MFMLKFYFNMCRYLEENHLEAFPIIYLFPELSKHISLYAWDLCNNQNIVLQTVPCNIHRYMRTCNMGVFDKLKPEFDGMAKEKLVSFCLCLCHTPLYTTTDGRFSRPRSLCLFGASRSNFLF